MNTEATIQAFLSSPAFAVAGASSNREKFGNKVLRAYLQNHKKVFPINPRAEKIEGVECVKKVSDLPIEVKSLSIITPPLITEIIVREAIAQGIMHIWMQPGAESDSSIALCQKHGLSIIAKGPCILIRLNFHEGIF